MRILFVIIISLTFSVGVFAADTSKDGSGTVQSGTTVETKEAEQGDTQEEEKETKEEAIEAKKEKIKQEISSYIIDSYKAQGDKILKDIDQTLQKTAPDKDDRVEAYKKIRTSLAARRNKNNTSKKVNETSKLIVGEFLNHMIESIDKKITELSK